MTQHAEPTPELEPGREEPPLHLVVDNTGSETMSDHLGRSVVEPLGVVVPVEEVMTAGEQIEFEKSLIANYANVLKHATRIMGSREDAEDVAQHAFERAWKQRHQFRGDSEMGTWLFRITHNVAVTFMDRNQRQRAKRLLASRNLQAVRQGDDAIDIVDATPENDPASRLDATLLRERLEVALAQLPEKLRHVVLLRDTFDMTHEQIAEYLGISESAAKVRLHRARKKLREMVFPELPGESRDL